MEKVDPALFNRKKSKTALITNLEDLEIGEVILFKEEEKNFKSKVNTIIYNHFSLSQQPEKKFSSKKMEDLEGWLIKRTK